MFSDEYARYSWDISGFHLTESLPSISDVLILNSGVSYVALGLCVGTSDLYKRAFC